MNKSDFVGIGKVQLANFKSIKRDPIEKIELAPLTLLCGENSSGKSTVLHSILLQLQSLSLNKTSSAVLPLNGLLIKLNNFMNILHSNEQDDRNYKLEEVFKSEDFEMNIGITFNKFNFNNTKMAPVYRELNNFKINLQLKPEMSYENPSNSEIAAFPENHKTTIEHEITYDSFVISDNPQEKIVEKERYILDFSQLPIENQQVKVFEFQNEEPKLKQYPNKKWQCNFKIITTSSVLIDKTLVADEDNYEEYITRYDTIEEETNNQVFGGVDFESGIPSKVYDRVLLADYLAKKHTEQIKILAEDTNQILAKMAWIEDIEEIEELKETDLMVDGELVPKVNGNSIADKIARHYTLLTEEDFNLDIREGIYSNSEEEISEGAFALRWNVAPWANANYKHFYTEKEQLALDLIESFNNDPYLEHDELLDVALGSFAASYIYDIVKYEKSFDDISDSIKKDLNEIFNDKFFNYLQVELSNSFQSIFNDEKTLFIIFLMIKKTKMYLISIQKKL